MASPAIGTGTGNVQTYDVDGNTAAESITISSPTNAVTGDRLIMVVSLVSGRTMTASGWTSLQAQTQTLGGKIEVWTRTHDGSSSYTVTWTSQGNTYRVGGIVLVTGQDGVDVSAKYDSAFTTSTATTAPSVTTTVADTLLLNFYSTASANRTWSPASSQTEVFDIDDNTNGPSLEMTKLDVASSGATGTKTSTCSSSAFWASISVAIKPAPATPRSSVAMVIG